MILQILEVLLNNRATGKENKFKLSAKKSLIKIRGSLVIKIGHVMMNQKTTAEGLFYSLFRNSLFLRVKYYVIP